MSTSLVGKFIVLWDKEQEGFDTGKIISYASPTHVLIQIMPPKGKGHMRIYSLDNLDGMNQRAYLFDSSTSFNAYVTEAMKSDTKVVKLVR